MTRLPALLFLVALSPLAFAERAAPIVVLEEEDEERDTSVLNLDKNKLALQGYDPVAYFEEGGGKAKKGVERFTLVHEGVTYRFANQKNLDAFERTPARYEPLYGGWCAYAMSKGEHAGIDPESFIVTDEGLFVFYDSFFADTRKKWRKEGHAKLKPKADASWTEVLRKAEEERKKRRRS